MKWIIGLDIVRGHEGPVQLAVRVHALGLCGRGGTLVGVHVVPRTDPLSVPLALEDREKLRSFAHEAVDALLERAHAREVLGDPKLIDGDTVHGGLAEVAERTRADAIVVGRRARRGDEPWVRLGPVARRLLRSLPTTVIVTPPEGQSCGGEGPIVLATDMEEHSERATTVATQLAVALGRPLVAVHVVPALTFAKGHLGGRFDQAVQTREHEQTARLREWAHDRGLSRAGLVTLSGEPVRGIADAALAHDAVMVVVGSRRLSTAARIFEPSFATELAASSWSPVAVVPGA